MPDSKSAASRFRAWFFPAVHPVDHEEVGPATRFPAFEVLAWTSAIATLVFLKLSGLEMGWEALSLTTPDLALEIARNIVLVGIPLHLLYRLLTRRSLGAYLRNLVTHGWLLLTLRAWLALLVVFTAYMWLKVSVPLLNYTLWDDALWKLDRVMHGGFSPNVVIAGWLEGSRAARVADAWYSLWFATTVAGSLFFVAFANSRFRRRFLLSFVAVWMLGCWCYLAFPALGPAYAFPEVMERMQGSLPLAERLQRTLWDNYEIVVAARTEAMRPFAPAYGVAAMPSLHVGLHWLLTVWVRRVAPRLFIPFALGTLFTFVGSILTGWHYAVDGYVGILLAHACYRIALLSERSGNSERRVRRDLDLGARGTGAAP